MHQFFTLSPSFVGVKGLLLSSKKSPRTYNPQSGLSSDAALSLVPSVDLYWTQHISSYSWSQLASWQMLAAFTSVRRGAPPNWKLVDRSSQTSLYGRFAHVSCMHYPILSGLFVHKFPLLTCSVCSTFFLPPSSIIQPTNFRSRGGRWQQ